MVREPIASAMASIRDRARATLVYTLASADVCDVALNMVFGDGRYADNLRSAGGWTRVVSRAIDQVCWERQDALSSPVGSVLCPTTIADVLRSDEALLRQEVRLRAAERTRNT